MLLSAMQLGLDADLDLMLKKGLLEAVSSRRAAIRAVAAN